MEEKISAKKQKNTTMAIVAYLFFFIPLLTDAKNDPFVQYHVKQGLIIFIGWTGLSFLCRIFPWYSILGMVLRILNLVIFILTIIGIVNTIQGKEKPLPLLGKFGEQFKI